MVSYAVLVAVTVILYVVLSCLVAHIYYALVTLSLPLNVFAFLFANDIQSHKRRNVTNNLSATRGPERGPTCVQTTAIPMETLFPGALAAGYNFEANVCKTRD